MGEISGRRQDHAFAAELGEEPQRNLQFLVAFFCAKTRETRRSTEYTSTPPILAAERTRNRLRRMAGSSPQAKYVRSGPKSPSSGHGDLRDRLLLQKRNRLYCRGMRP